MTEHKRIDYKKTDKALLKAKYQSEWTDLTNDKLSRYHNDLNELEEESEKNSTNAHLDAKLEKRTTTERITPTP